ncbi:glycosyltransferase [Acidobacteria bacterium AB60]|nr:glycosyltransferase [Acidobacteria bacterium AB60]
MRRKLRIAYFAHSIRSDWNNGNAHFLRGLLRALGSLGHEAVCFEPASEWSIDNLRKEPQGEESLRQFAAVYPDLTIQTYDAQRLTDRAFWKSSLAAFDVVILHEWNSPALSDTLVDLRRNLKFCLLFHDTHHRASSSPQQISLFNVREFDGILVFGEVLRRVYAERFGIERVWVLHEAADTTVFHPLASTEKTHDLVWVGNWGDEERTREISEYLLQPATQLPDRKIAIYGVRYPDEAIQALHASSVQYGGYLPNLCAPRLYSDARLTVHIPRRQYATSMPGIPTIRVFEALACGIPLISAPWQDSDQLFRPGDLLFAKDGEQMLKMIECLLNHPAKAQQQALNGLETILARHTCRHRAEELTDFISEEILP